MNEFFYSSPKPPPRPFGARRFGSICRLMEKQRARPAGGVDGVFIALRFLVL